MKERQKELRKLAYIIHIMDNPDICLDLDDYFKLQDITSEKLENACIEFDSIYPMPNNFTKDHMYKDSLRVIFDTATRNIINTTFNGLTGIKSMPYRKFLETLLSVKGPLNLTEEQFEFLYALKFDPDFISDLYKKRVRNMGHLYNNGLSAITCIKDRNKRIAAMDQRIRKYDDDISNQISESYTKHMVAINDLLTDAGEIDSELFSSRFNRSSKYIKNAKEAMADAERQRKLEEERRKERERRRKVEEERAAQWKAHMKQVEEKRKKDREMAAIATKFNDENARIILSTFPKRFTDNECINAILVSAWVYWLIEVCKIKDEHVTYATKYWGNTIHGCIILTKNRLEIINHPEKDNILLPVAGGAIQLSWEMAVISDFYLIECLFANNISISEFLKVKTNNEFKKFALGFRMRDIDLKAAHDCLNNYCSKEFAQEFIKQFKAIIEAPIIKVNDFTEEDVKSEWVLQNMTAGVHLT